MQAGDKVIIETVMATHYAKGKRPVCQITYQTLQFKDKTTVSVVMVWSDPDELPKGHTLWKDVDGSTLYKVLPITRKEHTRGHNTWIIIEGILLDT